MENLFRDHYRPSIRLIDSILILGIPNKTLRKMFLENETITSPDLIIQLPPSQKSMNHILRAIFHPYIISLEKTPKYPSFFSTTYTNSNGKIDYLHCMKIYEKINPTILELSKETRNHEGFMKFVNNDKETKIDSEVSFFMPVVLCIKTSAKYLDLFRNILTVLYSQFFLEDYPDNEVKKCMMSTEFIKNCIFLVNDLVIPPAGVKINFILGGSIINIPVEYDEKFQSYENCVSVLIDLMDVKNIIIIWEYLLSGKSIVFVSNNDYIIYLIIQAFISLIFPFKISQNCVPLTCSDCIKDYLANKPVIIGINSSSCSLREVVSLDREVNVIDINSNILHSVDKVLLCDCIQCEIGQKFQYIKAYNYIDRERLNIYRMSSLEKTIKDSDFLKKTKSLIDCFDENAKDHLFVYLVREIFFSMFCKYLASFENLIVIQSLTGSNEFHIDLFVQTLEKCENCTLEVF